jgi:Tfp pilus assembly protein PilN
MPLFGRSIILGVEALTESVARSLDMSFDHAMELLPEIPVFNMVPVDARMGQAGQVARTIFSDIGDELLRSLEFYKSQVGEVKIDQVILTGPGCMLPNVDEYFTSKLRMKTILGNPMRDMVADERFVSARMKPILSALVGSSIDPTWNPSITVDLHLNKEGRLPLVFDERSTMNILDEPVIEPSWFKPGLGAAVDCLALTMLIYSYFAFIDMPAVKKEAEAVTLETSQGKASVASLKQVRQNNELLVRRKELLKSLVGGVKPWSAYLEAVRDNTPAGVQISQLELDESGLKLQGNAVNFSRVSDLSINLGASPLLQESNIESASRPEKRPEVVSFIIDAKVQKKVDTGAAPASDGPHTVGTAKKFISLSSEVR